MPKMKLPKALRLPKTRGGRVFLVAVVIIVAAIVAYYVQDAVRGDASQEVTYTTGSVEKMTLTSSVSGEGNIEWLHAEDVTSGISGTVDQLKVALGQEVEEDDYLFHVAGSMRAHWVKAPVSGTITALNIARGDEVESTSTDPAATVIDLDAFRASITVAESDISTVEVGQKAVITFDSLPDLTLTGKVTAVDYRGTNTSGVVSYAVLVTPDTPHEDVRGGMTVSVSIITDLVTDVLAVPASAVKTASDGTSYVQTLGDDGTLSNVTVETGMTTDSYVEITSGLTEGQEIVVSSTKSGSTTATTTSQRGQNSLLDGGGIPGGGMPSGGGFAPPGQ